MLARLAYAILVGLITFLVVTVIGNLLHVGLIVAYAGIIAVLVAIVVFLTKGPGQPLI